jgi:hypothetical protein
MESESLNQNLNHILTTDLVQVPKKENRRIMVRGTSLSGGEMIGITHADKIILIMRHELR